MRAVLQRVTEASVRVEGEVIGAISRGLLVLLGAEEEDTETDLRYLVDKTLNLRIFEDEQGKMNLSLLDTGGELLVVSQFTLLADCRKGRRPSFTRAMAPQGADELVCSFVSRVRERGVNAETGRFGAMMEVRLVNQGPVTIILDSRHKL